MRLLPVTGVSASFGGPEECAGPISLVFRTALQRAFFRASPLQSSMVAGWASRMCDITRPRRISHGIAFTGARSHAFKDMPAKRLRHRRALPGLRHGLCMFLSGETVMRSIRKHALVGSAFMAAVFWLAGCTTVNVRRTQPDARQRVELTRTQREKVLAEMRQFLESVNSIMQGIASDDLDLIERSARTGGTTLSMETDPALRSRLPESFVAMGLGTHQAFDNLAIAASEGKTSEHALNRLAEITGRCVGCHASYKMAQDYQPVTKYGPPPSF